MKFLRLVGLLVLSLGVGSGATAALRGTPFPPAVDQRFSDLEGEVDTIQESPVNNDYTEDGILLMRIARATYDVTVDGGTVGTHALGVTLPAASVITRSWMRFGPAFSDSGSGTVAIHCEDANNILSAADLTVHPTGGFLEGASTGATAAMKAGIAADCPIIATVATTAQLTGRVTVWIEYVGQ